MFGTALPPSHTVRPGIGIVSLCSYDAANTSMTALSADNKLRYARHHGYELFFETRVTEPNRPIAWSKVRGDARCTHTLGCHTHSS